jgi:hypothetical protein
MRTGLVLFYQMDTLSLIYSVLYIIIRVPLEFN